METRRTMLPAITLSNDPCPFCAFPPEKAVLVEIGRLEGMTRRLLYQVACVCGAAGPLRSSPAESAFAWRGARGRESPAAEAASWIAPRPQPAPTVEVFSVWSSNGTLGERHVDVAAAGQSETVAIGSFARRVD